MKPLILPFERIHTFEESNLLKRAILKASEVFESWGYNYLKLPVFDHYEVHGKALGDKVRNAIVFKDISEGSLVALRADFTTQVVRSVSFFKVWHYPLRVYYFGTLFSSEGSTYEKFQAGVELIGVKEIEGDAEVISAVHEFLKGLGLKEITVTVGHVGIVRSILSRIEEEKREQVKRAFMEKNLSFLRTAFGGGPESELPLAQGGDEVLDLLRDLGLEREREELTEIGRHLSAEGINFIYDLSEVREFPYYTGVVFEMFVPELGAPVAGGGRYDELSKLYGGDFPATGGTVYVDKLLEVIDSDKEKKDFFVVDLSEEKEFGFKIASYLRRKGYKVGRDIVRRNLEHSLDYAFEEGYTKVVVLLDDKDVRIYTTPKDFQMFTLKDFLELF